MLIIQTDTLAVTVVFHFVFCLSSTYCPGLLFTNPACFTSVDTENTFQYRHVVLSQVIPLTLSVSLFANKPEMDENAS